MNKENTACVCVCVHSIEYYSTFKKKENLSQTTIWIKLENIMPSEISQMLYDSPVRYLK